MACLQKIEFAVILNYSSILRRRLKTERHIRNRCKKILTGFILHYSVVTVLRLTRSKHILWCYVHIERIPLDAYSVWRPYNKTFLFYLFLKLFLFSVRLLSVLRGHSFFLSQPQRPMTSDFKGFSIPDFIHYIYFPILILEKEPVFSLLNVQC